MNHIPVRIEDTSLEVFARIARSEAHKYDCSMDIDYSGTNRNIRMRGDCACGPHIMEELKNIFIK
ncbi:MAG: hypothetical protein AB7S75_17660 [Desulfococcaceae bacterium]